MEIEFDPAKDAINIAKHGVSLAFGINIFDDPTAIVVSAFRPEDNEVRSKIIGRVGDRLWTAVHIVRDGTYRMISVRKSNEAEQRGYDRDPRGPE